jgi:hypothetical protein
MSVFEGRGSWRMGKDFVEYRFNGSLLRAGQTVSFDDVLRVDRLADGNIQIQMNSKTTDGEVSGTWIAEPQP